ncbi:MAG TPA: ATP-binding protein [Longimicrobium sp.]|jgi:signal transduction histidine kinase
MHSTPAPLRLSPGQRVAATFGGTLIVLVFGALAYHGAARERDTRAAVNNSRGVIEELHKAIGLTVDAETGQRGYLLTRRAEYLEPYSRARDSVQASLTTLRELTEDDVPAQRARVDSLAFLLGGKFDELEETLAVARADGVPAALRIVGTGRGRERMDQARAMAQAIGNHERDELERLDLRAARYENGLLATLALGTALATLVSLLLNGVLERYGASQARFAAALEGAYAQLEEQQVELELQNEQLQEQSGELEAQNEQLHLVTSELEERTEAAEAANVAKARFLAAMSHDLRTPLNAIAGYVDLLEMGVRGPVSEAQVADLQRIRHSGRRLLAMINDILSFARIEAGRVEVHPEPVPLEPVLREMESSFLPQLASRGLQYDCLPSPRPLVVQADPEKMQQVVLNLVTNAIKFTEPGGRVTLSCEEDGDGVLVRVRDTGRGIPPEKLPGIFEPFVQVDREKTAQEHQGVGLGLAISRELARAMGGDLTAESTAGRGSCFTLRLPKAAAGPDRRPSPGAADDRGEGDGATPDKGDVEAGSALSVGVPVAEAPGSRADPPQGLTRS